MPKSLSLLLLLFFKEVVLLMTPRNTAVYTGITVFLWRYINVSVSWYRASLVVIKHRPWTWPAHALLLPDTWQTHWLSRVWLMRDVTFSVLLVSKVPGLSPTEALPLLFFFGSFMETLIFLSYPDLQSHCTVLSTTVLLLCLSLIVTDWAYTNAFCVLCVFM